MTMTPNAFYIWQLKFLVELRQRQRTEPNPDRAAFIRHLEQQTTARF